MSNNEYSSIIKTSKNKTNNNNQKEEQRARGRHTGQIDNCSNEVMLRTTVQEERGLCDVSDCLTWQFN